MPMETGHDLEHTTERLTEGFKVPMGNGVSDNWTICRKDFSFHSTQKNVM